MKTATINFKVDEPIKQQAQAISAVIGIPLGSLLNAYVKELVNSQEVHFSVASVRKTRTIQQIYDNLSDTEREELRQLLNYEHVKRSVLDT